MKSWDGEKPIGPCKAMGHILTWLSAIFVCLLAYLKQYISNLKSISSKNNSFVLFINFIFAFIFTPYADVDFIIHTNKEIVVRNGPNVALKWKQENRGILVFWHMLHQKI